MQQRGVCVSTKDELRKKFKIKRKYFQNARREVADDAVRRTVLELFAQKDSFFIYRSFGSETDTTGLIASLISLGKRVFLPRVEGNDIVAVRYAEGAELSKSAFGTLEPCGQAFAGGIDVVIVPLLALNRRGFRLGYGGGFYDRYLRSSAAVKAGICYDFQLTDEFSEDPWDEPLDLAVTEKGVYHFAK